MLYLVRAELLLFPVKQPLIQCIFLHTSRIFSQIHTRAVDVVHVFKIATLLFCVSSCHMMISPVKRHWMLNEDAVPASARTRTGWTREAIAAMFTRKRVFAPTA